MFRPICLPAFFRCLSNSGTFKELRTTSFIESTGVACSDSVCHNRVQVLSNPVLLLAGSQDWTCNLQMIVSLEASGTNAYNRYAMCPAGQITIKMKTIVRKPLMIKINKLRLRNFDNKQLDSYLKGPKKLRFWHKAVNIWRLLKIELSTS